MSEDGIFTKEDWEKLAKTLWAWYKASSESPDLFTKGTAERTKAWAEEAEKFANSFPGKE